MVTLKHVVEALLFASQKALTPAEIHSALKAAFDYAPEDAPPEYQTFAKAKAAEIGVVLAELQAEYESLGRAFRLGDNAGGWQLVTEPESSPWVRMLFPEARPTRLSGPALETLAIVAYRQPIIKADIEAVRGVAVDGVMQTLLDRGLVKIGGRADIPGRPLLYETTQFFMEHFGLRTLDELPNSTELRRMTLPTAPQPAEAAAPANQMELGETPAASKEVGTEETQAPEVTAGAEAVPDSAAAEAGTEEVVEADDSTEPAEAGEPEGDHAR